MWLTVLLILLTIILLTVIGFLAKALRIQVNKAAVYENWIVELQNKVDRVYLRMHELDNQQWFSKDDEVGTVFGQMVELIDSLNEKTTKE